jgi:hypothetical protein
MTILFDALLACFLVYLLYLWVRNAPLSQKEAKNVGIIATIVWSIMVALCGFGLLLSGFGFDNPHLARTTEILVWAIIISLLLTLLLSLYALSNIWQRYRTEDYPAVIRFAAVPFIGLVLLVTSYVLLGMWKE